MKASPFSLLLFSSWLIVFSIGVLAQSGQYTVQVDSMTAQDAAENKVQTLKSQGQNAYWLKSNIPGQGLRYRVRIGRFPSRVAAQSHGARLKQQGVTSDFFVALFEGTSSPLSSATAVKKAAPAMSGTQKNAPAENKAAENKNTENKAATSGAQRQREVKPISPPLPVQSAVPINSTTDKRLNNIASPAVTKPSGGSQPVAPQTAAPGNNAVPKQVTPTPPDKSWQSKPLNSPLQDEVKPPRDKKAENTPPGNISTPSTASTMAAAVKTDVPIELGLKGPAAAPAKPMISEAGAPPSADAFRRFEERVFGYSFEHPNYWNGGRLNQDELQAQRIDAGAVFRSQEDVAFMNAIWNSLKNANSPAYDNNLIVDLVIKSLSSGTGLQGLSEVSRRMVQEGDQIKTFVDLRTLFRQPRANTPLEFQGKAVIIRANTGILLVVTFYSKDGAPTMIAAAERIISSARVP